MGVGRGVRGQQGVRGCQEALGTCRDVGGIGGQQWCRGIRGSVMDVGCQRCIGVD